MIFQISAGKGPEECELAAGRIFEALQKEFPQIVKISGKTGKGTVSYTHLRAHETGRNLVCRLLLEKKKKKP